jgi:molecular chaperone GrpE (heat shock protein)
MSKAILEFDLNDLDDKMEFKRCTLSLEMALAIWEIVHNTRKGLYHDAEFNKSGELSVYDGIDMVYEKIHSILDERGITNIDDLIY